MSLKVKNRFHSEYKPLSQKINEEELETTGFVGKKEIDDSRLLPRRSDKMKKSQETVVGKKLAFKVTDQKPTSAALQFRLPKRETNDDNFSTMVQCDTSPPASPNPNGSFDKSKLEITSHRTTTVNIDSDVFDCDSPSSVADIVILSSSDDEASTSPSEVPKVKNKLRGTLESNKNKLTITGLPGLDQSTDLDMTRNIFDQDRCSTVAHVGDYRKKSRAHKRTIESSFPPRHSDKMEKSHETVLQSGKELAFNNTDHKSASANSQLRLVKKEESNDNFSTMVHHDIIDISPPASPNPNATVEKNKSKITSHGGITVNNDSDLPGRHSSLLARGSVLRTASDTVVSTSPLEVSKVKTKPRGMIESSKKKLTISVTTELDVSADLAMTSNMLDNCVNERSVWDLDHESEGSRDDRSSDEDCNECSSGMDIDERTAGDSTSSPKGDKLSCLDCPAVFETKEAFGSHIASHEGYRRFKCDVCKKRFINSGNLIVHKRTHTGERPFKCDVCEKRFSRSDSLENHKLIHTGENPFKCNICNLRFNRSSLLKEHARIHTGEKPHKCLVCGKCYRRSGSLLYHKRIHTSTQNLPDVSQNGMDQPSIASHSLPSDSVDDQKIRFRSNHIDYIIEKMASKNPTVAYIVWSKMFNMDLASAVARSGYNCLLCVKKFLPASFPGVLHLSNTVQTSLIDIGPDAKKFRLFSFGGMVIPERIVRPGGFKSLAKLEAKLAKFSRSQGMELVNIFKHGKKNNGWYESLRRGLKEDCIITDTF